MWHKPPLYGDIVKINAVNAFSKRCPKGLTGKSYKNKDNPVPSYFIIGEPMIK